MHQQRRVSFRGQPRRRCRRRHDPIRQRRRSELGNLRPRNGRSLRHCFANLIRQVSVPNRGCYPREAVTPRPERPSMGVAATSQEYLEPTERRKWISRRRREPRAARVGPNHEQAWWQRTNACTTSLRELISAVAHPPSLAVWDGTRVDHLEIFRESSRRVVPVVCSEQSSGENVVQFRESDRHAHRACRLVFRAWGTRETARNRFVVRPCRFQTADRRKWFRPTVVPGNLSVP